LESLLIETDSPYLCPHSRPGKRNAPAHLPLIAERLAELRRVSLETIVAATTENFHRIFPHKAAR